MVVGAGRSGDRAILYLGRLERRQRGGYRPRAGMRASHRPAGYAAKAMPATGFTLRTDLRPGDLGWIVHRHGAIYAAEEGYDLRFEAYVAGPLARFALVGTDRERLWIAEDAGRFSGCLAVVDAFDDEAQLRWFLVEPASRGRGLGRRLLETALAFSREQGYTRVGLWTVAGLEPAGRLYREAGFERAETREGAPWGVEVVEERWVLALR
jgi:GNAT superfamily N-acetyltransferase